jgi:hypothetical protein
MSDKVKVAASITIYDIPNMTKRGRLKIVDWLRNIANDIAVVPQMFDKRFRARYVYLPKKAKIKGKRRKKK